MLGATGSVATVKVPKLAVQLKTFADVRVVATWLRDGNHPNWLEDGRLSMNYEGKVCAFDDVEGASCQVLSERASGHPVGVPGRGDLVVTDTYAKEHAAFGLEAGEAASAARRTPIASRAAPSLEARPRYAARLCAVRSASA